MAGQKTGDETLIFMYDNNGNAFGFTYNGEEYYYIKNVQNDIVAIANKNGTVVANYYYDAWGNVTRNNRQGSLGSNEPSAVQKLLLRQRRVITTSNHAIILPKSAGS